MIVTTNDGLRLEGESREILRLLRAASRDPARSERAFMRETARRATAQTGIRVSSASPARFVESLIDAGLLREEREDEPR